MSGSARDLATATGQRPAWDDRVVEVAFGAISHGLPARGRLARFEAIVAQMPPEIRPTTPPFAEAVEVPAGAAPIDALVAWTGRRPSPES